MIAAIVFDMDGTLLDSLHVVVECYRRTVLELGDRDPGDQEILDAFAHGPAATMLTNLIGRPVGSAGVHRYEELLRERAPEVRPYDGIVDALRLLAGTVPLGVFTAADTSAAELLLRAAGLRDHLDVVIGADGVDRPKPAPDGLLAACERLGVAPSDAAYVGDGPSDVAVARSAGAMSVVVRWGHQFAEGRGAVVTLTSPADLLQLAGTPRNVVREERVHD